MTDERFDMADYVSIIFVVVVFLYRDGCVRSETLIRSDLDENQRKIAFADGDYVIGALFPIHRQPDQSARIIGNKIVCGDIREQYGMQRVEAALWTIEQINRLKILGNYTLGIEIRDTCWNVQLALRQALKFVEFCRQTSNTSSTTDYDGPAIVGVIGPASSDETIEVQNLLQIARKPQIGYSSTGSSLSNKSRYGYFVRVVPSDQYQARVMVSILKELNWTYVHALSTVGPYGTEGIEQFRFLLENTSVCIAQHKTVAENSTEETYKAIFDIFRYGNGRYNARAKIIVCFCEGEVIKRVFEAIKRIKAAGEFIVLGSDGWGGRYDVVQGVEKIAEGSMTIRVRSLPVLGFDEYYFDLYKRRHALNPWIDEFWQYQFNCSLNETTDKTLCTGEENMRKNYVQDPKLSFIVKSIYTFANALKNFIEEVCPRSSVPCSEIVHASGEEFLQYVKNTSFVYQQSGENEMVIFNNDGDPMPRYEILQFFRKLDGSYNYKLVGNWDNNTLKLNGRELNVGLKSTCSDNCEIGERKIPSNKCCWTCDKCDIKQISNGTNCILCDDMFMPNENLTVCVKMPLRTMPWKNVPTITALSISIVGIVITTCSMIIFLKNGATPVVKLSTKELSYAMFCGMILSHVCVFIMLLQPTTASCILTRSVPGISVTIMYGALLVKTKRIARIFSLSKKRFPKIKPKYISTQFQISACCLLVVAEAVICAVHLILDPAKVIENRLHQEWVLILRCHLPHNELIASHSLNVILLAFCTLYAFKTRYLPDNFNETKFIAFSCYATSITWVAFIFVYLSSNDDAFIQTISMCVTLAASALINLTCLFFPKLYIILWRPEKNKRSYYTTNKSIRSHFGSTSLAHHEELSTRLPIYQSCGVNNDVAHTIQI